jgi:hypothetical protein
LGYNDKNYQISSILSLTHLQVQLANARGVWIKSLEVWKTYLSHLKFEKNKDLKEGGSSTTGGGGEHSPATYKFILLYHLMFDSDNLKKFSADELEVLKFILDMKIEVDWKTKWTPLNIAALRIIDGKATLWLPINFVIEKIVHKPNASHPEFILNRVIRPAIKSIAEKNAVHSCRKFYAQ